MPFSKESLDFLAENQLHDSKEWYNDHKDDYKSYVIEPFRKLIEDLSPTMLDIDPRFTCNPAKISRLYRDARFSKGKSIFRDDVWYSFSVPKEPFESKPEFYFEISPEGFSYGCGYYCAGKDSMDALRERIIKNDKMYIAAQKAYEKQSVFKMGGDMYKKNHFPEQSEKKCLWLNRKSIYFYHNSTDFEMLFSDGLSSQLAKEFLLLKDVYAFLSSSCV